MDKDKALALCDAIDEVIKEVEAVTGLIYFKPAVNQLTNAIRSEVNKYNDNDTIIQPKEE